jgi:hypothetical protein
MSRVRGPNELGLPSGPQPDERAKIWAKWDSDSKKRYRTNRARARKAAYTRRRNALEPKPVPEVTVTIHALDCSALRSGECDCGPP